MFMQGSDVQLDRLLLVRVSSAGKGCWSDLLLHVREWQDRIFKWEGYKGFIEWGTSGVAFLSDSKQGP